MKEFLKIKNCKYLLSLTKAELKAIIYDSNEYSEDGDKYSWEVYHSQIIKYLKLVVLNNGVMDMQYRYAKNRKMGRMYSKSFGIQNLQYKIRGFIIDDNYKDYDCVNMHPCLLLYLCKKHGIDTPQLELYCEKRAETLKTYKITKINVLVAINSDQMRTKNQWLKVFINEMSVAKNLLLSKYAEDYLETDNIKNPISSRVNLLLCKTEDEIIQLVANTLKTQDFTLMFDGILCKEDLDISFLNKLTEKYNVVWTQKPHNNEIYITDGWVDPDIQLTQDIKDSNLIYEKLKINFEKDNCMILSPLGYMSRVGKDYVLYSHEKMKVLHQASPMLKNDDGKKIRFISKWLLDENKKCFNGIDFIPFNKEGVPLCSDKFNTFIPYSYLDEYVSPNMDFIKNYVQKLIFNLCGEEVIAYNYLLKYIANMVQYPNRQCEQSIVMLSDKEGAGKDRLTYMIEKMLDNRDYTLKTSDPELVFGHFNSDAQRKIMIQINEQSNKSALEYLETFKDRTTAEYVLINPKGQIPYVVKNCMRLFIASNNKKAVVLSGSDRRFVVIKSTNLLVQNHTFFKEFMRGVDDKETIAGIFHYFNDMDIEGFCLKKELPMTRIKRSMTNENRPPLMSFLQEFTSMDAPPDGVSFKEDIWIMKKTTLRQYYKDYLNECGLNNNITSQRFNMEVEGMEEITAIRTSLLGEGIQRCYKINRVLLHDRLVSEDVSTPEVEDNEEGFIGGCLIDSDDETDNL